MSASPAITLPKRKRGRQTTASAAEYQAELDSLVAMILQIRSPTGFYGFIARLVLHPGV